MKQEMPLKIAYVLLSASLSVSVSLFCCLFVCLTRILLCRPSISSLPLHSVPSLLLGLPVTQPRAHSLHGGVVWVDVASEMKQQILGVQEEKLALRERASKLREEVRKIQALVRPSAMRDCGGRMFPLQ